MRTLRNVRLTVRQLTHTLHLAPALSETFGGPNPYWLRDVLERLPNLQSLLVSRLPFFDHHSLLALRHASSARRPSLGSEDERRQYDLKLVIAEGEPNATCAGLREALFHFPQLVYLDLSYTSPARDASVLSAFANLWNLKVLKLRGVGMRDSEAEILANAIGIRVRLLDLRENYLTDTTVRLFMQACFLPPEELSADNNMNSRQIDDWPIRMAPGPNFLSLDSLRSEELDRKLFNQLTHPLTGRLALEDIPPTGLTHLYIADNNLSIEGLSTLLKSTRLHILDGGSVHTAKAISQTKSFSSLTGYQDEAPLPDAEKLVPVLTAYACQNLTYLRLDHAVVTKPTQAKEMPTPTVSTVPLAERASVVEVPAPAHYALQLSSEDKTILELSAEPPVSRSEVRGKCIHFPSASLVNVIPDGNGLTGDAEALKPPKDDGVFASEVVTNGIGKEGIEDKEDVVLNASGTRLSSPTSPVPVNLHSSNMLTTHKRHDPSKSPSSTVDHRSCCLPSLSASRLDLIDQLLRKRSRSPAFAPNMADVLCTDQSDTLHQIYTYLHPSHLPNLRTLVLTNVPAQVPASSMIIAALLRFISACADEEHLALLQAQMNYSLPPGHSRYAAEIQHARSLFALRTIVLEMDAAAPCNARMGKAWDHSRARVNMLKSSTGDRDSEALWSAAENDFSFFDEEGEEEDECGIYQNELPTANMVEKIKCSSSNSQRHDNRPHSNVGMLDSSRQRSPSTLHPATMRSPTLLQSPRNLPLVKNQRSSNATSHQRKESFTTNPRTGIPVPSEMPDTIPTSYPAHSPQPPLPEEESMVDVVAQLARFRKEKRSEYEATLLTWRAKNNPSNSSKAARLDERDMPFIEGHWKGEIKIVRSAGPKGMTGPQDMYGNSFERGYRDPYP